MQIQGGQKYRPPKVDVAAPDLYIPLVSAWAYLLLVGLAALLRGKYNPDMMYGTVSVVYTYNGICVGSGESYAWQCGGVAAPVPVHTAAWMVDRNRLCGGCVHWGLGMVLCASSGVRLAM